MAFSGPKRRGISKMGSPVPEKIRSHHVSPGLEILREQMAWRYTILCAGTMLLARR